LDLHELLSDFKIGKMLELHEQRYPYSHERDLILKNFTDFRLADDDFAPNCLKANIGNSLKKILKKR
jgi:hypothetical protein